jgi:phosphatidate cytidylyltransferase
VCPQNNLVLTPFEEISCEIPKVFSPKIYNLAFGLGQLETSPANIACLFVAFLSSVIAPFGGYVISAVKRAYNIKDFKD